MYFGLVLRSIPGLDLPTSGSSLVTRDGVHERPLARCGFVHLEVLRINNRGVSCGRKFDNSGCFAHVN